MISSKQQIEPAPNGRHAMARNAQKAHLAKVARLGLVPSTQSIIQTGVTAAASRASQSARLVGGQLLRGREGALAVYEGSPELLLAALQ